MIKQMFKNEWVWFGIFVLMGGILGFCINELIDANSNTKKINGLYFERFNFTSQDARDLSNEQEWGNWVCVNVIGMSYEDGINTCTHEVAHEIFAQYCEKSENIHKCMNITK